MKCPVCNDVNLQMSERQGVEIDYCPTCRGVWLDRGELDKIIERSNAQSVEPPPVMEPAYHQPSQQPYPTHHGRSDHHGGQGNVYGHPYKKKKSLLSELFDFD